MTMSSSEISKPLSGESTESKKPWQAPEIVDQSIAATTAGNAKDPQSEESGPLVGPS